MQHGWLVPSKSSAAATFNKIVMPLPDQLLYFHAACVFVIMETHRKGEEEGKGRGEVSEAAHCVIAVDAASPALSS